MRSGRERGRRAREEVVEGDMEGETERVRQRTRGRVEEQEPARRLQLPPGPVGANTQEVATDETATEEGGQSRTATTRIGQVLAGIVRGVATRIGNVWGAVMAGKRERGAEESEEGGEKRRRTGDG